MEGEVDIGPVWFKSQRYILAYMLSSGLMLTFLLRFNFGIAIVCMVNHTAVAMEHTDNHELYYQHHNGYDHLSVPNTTSISNITMDDHNVKDVENGISHSNDSCASATVSTSEREDGPLVWDKPTQGILLGALFWTYAIIIIPASHALRKMSRKRLVGVTMAVSSLQSCLMHGAALWTPWAVLVVKLAQGISSPLLFVSLYGMWTDWAPPQERAGLLTICFSGIVVANVIVFPVSAMLCKYGFLGGWPSIFYVFGMAGFLWTVLFMLLTSDSPASHPRISDKERHYIQSSLAGRSITTSTKVPWKSIITSPAVWAMFSAAFACSWGLFLFLGTLPLYMKEVLKFDIRGNGLYSTFPYLSMLLFSLLAGQCSDWLYRRNLLRLLTIRKMFMFLSNIIPAILLCIMSYLDCTQSFLAVGILTVALGFTGIGFSVFPVNPYDIAPRLAQSVIACSNCLSCVSGIVTPYLVTALTKNGTRSEWQVVMFFTAGVFVFGTVIFMVFGQAEVQEWAKPVPKNNPLIGQNVEMDGVKFEPSDENDC